MENAPQFDGQSFKNKFNELISDEEDKRIGVDKLKDLLLVIDVDQPKPTLKKTIKGFFFFSKAKFTSNILKMNEASMLSKQNKQLEKSKQQNKMHEGVDMEQQAEKKDQDEEHRQEQEQDSDSQQQKEQQNEEYPQLYKLGYQQSFKCAQLFTNKIKYQIWKTTAAVYRWQYELATLTKRSYFPIKDPGHFAKVNILIGDEMPTYNSYLHAKLQKKINKSSLPRKQAEAGVKASMIKKEVQSANDPMIKIRLQTENIGQSQLMAELWDKIYQMITSMVGSELADGQYFLSTIKISKQIQQNYFELMIKSLNPDLNDFFYAVTNSLNVIFKTEVRFIFQFVFQFSFDLKNLIQNPSASLYDFISRNVRIRLNYKGSQYVTALKELMIASDAFEGLRWVSDDQTSLMLIFLISSHALQLNLRFKNSSHEQAEQQSLRQLMTMIQGEIRPLLQNLKQQMPEVYQLLTKGVKKPIKVEVSIYDVELKGQLYLQNVDKVFLENAVLMGEGEADQEQGNGQKPQSQSEQQPVIRQGGAVPNDENPGSSQEND